MFLGGIVHQPYVEGEIVYMGENVAMGYAYGYEDIDSFLLQNREADGYTKKRHREMDLHNNKNGGIIWLYK